MSNFRPTDPADLLGAAKSLCHVPEECHTRDFILAGEIGVHPARKLLHGLASLWRAAGDADLRSTPILTVRLQYALGKSVAEIQPGKTTLIGGPDGACIGKITCCPDTDVHGSSLCLSAGASRMCWPAAGRSDTEHTGHKKGPHPIPPRVRKLAHMHSRHGFVRLRLGQGKRREGAQQANAPVDS